MTLVTFLIRVDMPPEADRLDTHVIVKIYGYAMYPALSNGQEVRIVLTHGSMDDIERGDIVAIRLGRIVAPSKTALRRVIAKQGDRVEIRSGVVWVNGAQEQGLRICSHARASYSMPLMRIPQRQIFVLGDFRSSSLDSHLWKPPGIDVKDVIGKVPDADQLPVHPCP